MREIKIFQMILSALLINSISSQTNSIDTTYGVCNCDITDKYCDLNCCCDPDCSLSDEAAFRCPILPSKTGLKWCLPNSMLFTQNTPYILESLSGFICLDINNSLSMNYYKPVLSQSLDESSVNSLVQLFDPPVNKQSILNLKLNENAPFFTTADNIWIITKNDVLGYLSIPNQVAGLQCKDGPPLKYLTNKNTSCITESSTLSCDGLSHTRFSIEYYRNLLVSFKILTKPSALVKCSSVDKFSCGPDYLKSITIRQCKWDSGKDCTSIDPGLLFPIINNGKCQNMIKNLAYVFEYNNPSGYTNAYLDLVLFDPIELSQNIKLEQIFEVKFVPNGVDSKIPIPVSSGNPGYQIGRPVLIMLNNNENPNMNFIDFSSLKFDSAGFCPESDRFRSPIKFGINMRTQCKLSYSVPNNQGSCSQLQKKIDDIILGFDSKLRGTKFAPFANSLTNETITIINSNPPDDVVFSDQCKGLRMDLGIRIAFANVGNINNPQAKILYIGYDWTQRTDIYIRCQTPECSDKYPSSLVLTTSVTFVDVSQPPLYTESQVRKPQATLPDDFFYPIGFSSVESLHYSNILNIFIALIVVILNQVMLE